MEETKRRAEEDAAMQRKRRALEQHRIDKQLRTEETKVSLYNREELDWASKQPNVFVKKTQPAININSTPIQVQQRTPVQSSQSVNDLSALAETFSASMSLIRLPAQEPTVFDGDPLKYNDWNIGFKALIEE